MDPQPPIRTGETGPALISDGRGAYYQAIHVNRKVKTYPIQEHELEFIGDSNWSATLWFSIGTGALSLVAGWFWDTLKQDSKTTPVSDGQKATVAILGLIAIVSFAFGLYYRFKRERLLDAIKKETVT